VDTFIEQQRASRIAERKNSSVTVGDEPLVIDLMPPIQSYHWTAYQLAVIGTFATRQPIANPLPTFGIYMVPIVSPVESLADAQLNGTFGWNPNARAIGLPYDLMVQRFGAAGAFAFICTARMFRECVLPTGWMFRFIANCAPGTATPGPGVGSQAAFFAHVIEESNSCPAMPQHV